MRVLFVMRHSGFVRNWENVVRLLAERGDEVHFGFEVLRPDAPAAEALAEEYPNVTYDYVPLRNDVWWPFLTGVRKSIDYLRYLRPEYRDANKLRARGADVAPAGFRALLRLPVFRSERARARLRRLLLALEDAVPDLPEFEEIVRAHGADVVMTTPLVHGHVQTEYMRAAQRLGLPAVHAVNSWDNLTNKDLLHVVPDRQYVWNAFQRDEAIRYHDVPVDRIAVVGAHTFDHWFHWGPSSTREEFCRRVGLDPSRPYLLYVGSSKFIVPDERPLVERWSAALRSSGRAPLETVGVLVRPHPSAGERWPRKPPSLAENMVVWPPSGADPRDPRSKADYFDSLYWSAGVVGVNTTALVEAAIVGKRTYTVTLPELADTQQGTLHFHYLMRENGGPLTVAGSLEEHLDDLARALEEPEPEGWNRPFLESFVRPHGLERDAAPLLVEDLGELLAGAYVREPRRAGASFLQLALLPAALVAYLWSRPRAPFRHVATAAELQRRKGALRKGRLVSRARHRAARIGRSA
jgi:hypothetical protein